MLPTLRPGDRLYVDAQTYRARSPRVGEIVVVVDPEMSSRWLVKRVGAVGPGSLWVLGDDPERSRDSRRFGPVALSGVVGRVFRCYAPADRRREF